MREVEKLKSTCKVRKGEVEMVIDTRHLDLFKKAGWELKREVAPEITRERNERQAKARAKKTK